MKRAADGRRQRNREIIDEKEKSTGPERILRNTSVDLKGTTFVILKNQASTPIRKEKVSREAGQNEFVKKDGIPHRVKSFRKVDQSKNRPRARPGLVKPIRNGPRNKEFDRE